MPHLVPPEKVARAELLLRVHPERTVAELTGISRQTIWRLKKNGWKAADRFRRLRPVPSDFAIQFYHMKRDELAKHYRCSNGAISRWVKEVIPESHRDRRSKAFKQVYPQQASTNLPPVNVGSRVDVRDSAKAYNRR